MNITYELTNKIEKLIELYARESSTQPQYLKSLAKEHQLLPILIGWDGFFGLRSDGEIFVVSTEEVKAVQAERDERIRRVAIFQGAKRYPSLISLIPERPFDAVDCQHCDAQGVIGFQNLDIVCYCGGLGWLKPDDLAGAHDLST